MSCTNLSVAPVTWSLRFTSTYSQKAYPLDKPVALSFTRLKAFRGPNDVNNSFTWETGDKESLKAQEISSDSRHFLFLWTTCIDFEEKRHLIIIQVVWQATNEEFVSWVRYHCGHHTYTRHKDLTVCNISRKWKMAPLCIELITDFLWIMP